MDPSLHQIELEISVYICNVLKFRAFQNPNQPALSCGTSICKEWRSGFVTTQSIIFYSTKFVNKIVSIYDTKQIYYKNIFHD